MIHHPEQRKISHYDRRITLWIVMVLHSLAFAVVIAGYSRLAELYPDPLATNEGRIGLPVWAGIVAAHWVLTLILDRVVGRGRRRMDRIQERLAEIDG